MKKVIRVRKDKLWITWFGQGNLAYDKSRNTRINESHNTKTVYTVTLKT